MGYKPIRFSFEELELCTHSFCEENLIGTLQCGKVYRGYLGGKEVLVKKWEVPVRYRYFYGENEERLEEEINLFQHSKMRHHPTMVKLIGYCNEGEEWLGAVLDLKPLDSLYNIVLKDSFTWLQRMKVIVGFACLLEVMHAKEEKELPYLLRNIDAHHIMLDEDYNPKLIDFNMVSGGVCLDQRFLPSYNLYGCYGYVNMHLLTHGEWCDKADVFAFGTLLLMLISKRNNVEEDLHNREVPFVHEWANNVYKPKKTKMGFFPSKWSLVHKSLLRQPGFSLRDGVKITKMAMRCVEYYPCDRPTMKQVVKCLLSLRVVRDHAAFLGIERLLGARKDATLQSHVDRENRSDLTRVDRENRSDLIERSRPSRESRSKEEIYFSSFMVPVS
ncbi:hypothetical protein LguiB_002356 [Lonicera macranthoides]